MILSNTSDLDTHRHARSQAKTEVDYHLLRYCNPNTYIQPVTHSAEVRALTGHMYTQIHQFAFRRQNVRSCKENCHDHAHEVVIITTDPLSLIH